MPIIRDPIHNSLQCKYGIAYCQEEKKLAVYSKEKRPDLQNLPTGWELNGVCKKADKKFIYCGVQIEFELVDIVPVGPSGAVSQLLGSCLKDNPILLTQRIEDPEVPDKEEIVIYPLNALDLKK